MSKRFILTMLVVMLSFMAASVQAQGMVTTTAVGNGADTDLSNDGNSGPNVIHGGSDTISIRYHPTAPRIRIALLRFDLTGIVGDLSDAELTMNVWQSKGDRPFNVYGLVDESLDNWDEATTTYNNSPGFVPGVPYGTWEMVEGAYMPAGVWNVTGGEVTRGPADGLLLGEFLAGDTNGLVTLAIIWEGDNKGDSYYIRSKEYVADPGLEPKLTLPHAEAPDIFSARDPQPARGDTVGVGLSELSWTIPDPNIPGDIIECEVWFGVGEPNAVLDHFGAAKISGRITDSFVAAPALSPVEDYFWIVDTYELYGGPSGGPQEAFHAGSLWQFNTNNEAPNVNAGANQYVWLAGDPASVTVDFDATVSDDGLPEGTLRYEWTQISGPEVAIDPADVEDVTLELTATGTYLFQLTVYDTVDDSGLSGSGQIQVVVTETPCEAAQATPGYQPITGDFDNDCIVDFGDLAELAVHWMECNSLVCP